MQDQTLNVWARGIALASKASGVFAAGLMLLSVFVVCHMVFVRAVLGQSSIWQTEFVTFALIAATFLGSPYILLTRGHVNVDLLPLVLGHAARKPLALLASGLAFGFCALFFYSSLHWWWEAWTLNLTTPSLWRARLWIPYLSVPVGLGLLCLQYVVDLWALFTDRDMPFGMSDQGSSSAQEGQS
jgi:TRAP-type C4-dicarboxylate transport system permease small subunit